MSEELKACPFCGGTKIKNNHDDGQHWQTCQTCFADGPPYTKYREEGEIEWNSRALAEPVICRDEPNFPKARNGGAVAGQQRYTCTGKGGDYQLLGLAQGAGTLKGFSHMVYRNVDGVMFVREPENFLARMEKIKTPAKPAPACGHPACKDLGEPHPFCDFVTATDANAELERLAKNIYNGCFSDAPGFVPWVEGGNSTMQDKARDQARKTLEAAGRDMKP